MKNLLLYCLFLSGSISSFAQSNHWSISVENTFSFTNNTNSFSNREDAFRITYNAFLRAEYQLTRNISATIGAGYLMSREYVEHDFEPTSDSLIAIKSHKFHHYAIAPIGVSFYFGSVFIRPEIGFGINSANVQKNELTYLVGPNSFAGVTGKYRDHLNLDQINSFTCPLMLTIGNDIPLNGIRLRMGFQGYYSLNPIGDHNQGHYYGFGTTIGVKF